MWTQLGKREEIWLSPVTKKPFNHRKPQNAKLQHKNATKNFGYTTIADRFWMLQMTTYKEIDRQ